MRTIKLLTGIGALLALTACNGLGNSVSAAFGASGYARMIDASPTTTQTGLALEADKGTINSGISESSRTGPYTKVTSGNITFEINTGSGTADVVPAINVNVAPSSNYSIVLQGEPGGVDYKAFGFADLNALNNANTVRFKVNNAAPNLATPVDVYLWQNTQGIPSTPTVAGLGLDQDSGTVTNAPGDPYIPTLGSSQTLPSGTYDLAIVPQGTVPNGTSDLFDGSGTLTMNNSYSFTIEDVNATQNNIGIVLAIDEPFQSTNQASFTRHSLSVTHHR